MNSGQPVARPRFFIVFVASLVALGPLSIDTYLPALPRMAEAFGVDIVAVNLTLSIYLLGFALGQILGGPLSDQVGRKVIGISGLVVFTVCSLVIAMAVDLDTVLVLRLLQAFGGGFATVVCMAMVRDAYPADQAAQQFPKVMLVMLTAPLAAPAIGAGLLEFGWASIFIFLAVYGVVMAVAFLRMPETAWQRTGTLAIGQILPQYFEVLSRREAGKLIPLRWILSQGCIASLMFVFITNSAFIYLEYFEVSEAMFVVYFGVNVGAMFVATGMATRLILKYSPFRMYTVARVVQLVAVTLLMLATVTMDISIWVFMTLLAIAMGCNGIINPSVQGMFLAPFQRLAGSASALMMMSLFTFGALLGGLSGLGYDGSLTPIVLTMFGAIIVGNLIALTIPKVEIQA